MTLHPNDTTPTTSPSTDRSTVRAVPADVHADASLVAGVYLARALDPLIDLARAVADRLRSAPERIDLAADLAGPLAPFTAPPAPDGQYPWPNAAHRDLTSMLTLNRFYQATGVYQGFAGLRLAAIHARTAAGGPDAAAARAAFADAAQALRERAATRVGPQAPQAPAAHTEMLTRATALLTSSMVAESLGVAPHDIWGDEPARHLLDPGLGRLCEALSSAVAAERPLTEHAVGLLQQVASTGSATLELVMDPRAMTEDDRLETAIGHAVAWAEALRELLSTVDVPRAWADPDYRRGLTPLERDVVPAHPAGQIDLEGTIRTEQPRYGQTAMWPTTYTVNGEICCSTGDLYCGGNTNGDCTLSDDCPTLTLILT